MATRLHPPISIVPPSTIVEADVKLRANVRPLVARLPVIATQLIGERIRAMYGSMAREPIPDELLELIRELEIKERAR